MSDLHLGRRNELDRFARKERHIEPRFLELLRHLEKHVDKIVLLGDIFETLKSVPGLAKKELLAVLDTYPEIARRVLNDARYQFVHGNHDAIAGRVLNAPEVLELEDHGTKMVFFHGHQLDRLTRGSAPVSRTGVWLGGILERLGLRVTPEDHRPVRDGALGKRHEVFARGAMRLDIAKKADIVITGHTHRAVRLEEDNRLFLNSGTCVAGRRELLLLDTAKHSYEVVFDPVTA